MTPDHVSCEHGHGRTNRRTLAAISVSPSDPAFAGMPQVHQIFQIVRERDIHRTGTSSQEVVYAISSADRELLPPERAAQIIRQHWQVENGLHRQKDRRMKEDDDATHTHQAPHNLGIIRNLALNILHRATAKGPPVKRWQTVKAQPWRVYAAMGI